MLSGSSLQAAARGGTGGGAGGGAVPEDRALGLCKALEIKCRLFLDDQDLPSAIRVSGMALPSLL